MIDLQGVALSYPLPKRYREHLLHPFRPRRRMLALRDVDLSVLPGQRLAVLGPNGAGKTTLLKLMGGLLFPSAGRVLFAGRNLAQSGHEARSRIGFVVNEERSFYWRLTGRQNLEFFAALENLQGRALRERSAVLLAAVGLERAADRRVSDYSAGMRQRLALARGLITDPDVLLLDEPTKSLDLEGAQAIRSLVLAPSERGGAGRRRTIVMTTNQLDDVVEVCEQLCVVGHGRILATRPLRGSTAAELADFYCESLVGKAGPCSPPSC